jgi:hypothetical protein
MFSYTGLNRTQVLAFKFHKWHTQFTDYLWIVLWIVIEPGDWPQNT